MSLANSWTSKVLLNTQADPIAFSEERLKQAEEGIDGLPIDKRAEYKRLIDIVRRDLMVLIERKSREKDTAGVENRLEATFAKLDDLTA